MKLSQAELETAEERFQKQLKNKSSYYLQPIQLFHAFPSFEPLKFLLQGDSLYKGIFSLLYSAMTKGIVFVSDSLLNETLHLLLLSIKLYIRPDLVNKTSLGLGIEKNSPQKRKSMYYSGNMNDIEFPTTYNITKNARYEIAISESKQESIISLLVHLSSIPAFVHHTDKINAILSLFGEHDPSCKLYVEKLRSKALAAQENSKTMEIGEEEDEQEKKRRRKERQLAIMSKFNQGDPTSLYFISFSFF